MRELFVPWNPKPASMDLVRIANDICAEMRAQGYNLTLRQLYYQFVARGYIPNTDRSYKNLGNVVNKGRLAGLIDWRYLEDRTRNIAGGGGFDNPGQLVQAYGPVYGMDHWEGQEYRVEVWVEKEALVDVAARAANRLDVAYFACRGYVSQSELYAAAQRHREYEEGGQHVVVVHLGDHDPSGIDMTRDIQERLEMFEVQTDVRRIALNMDQIDQYSPPPNPAKITDSRAGGYIRQHGRSSWELDALEPSVINQLIQDETRQWLDQELWDEVEEREQEGKAQLGKLGNNWPAVAEFLEGIED